jgi:transcriptional regulator with AAA-type ATPase domain
VVLEREAEVITPERLPKEIFSPSGATGVPAAEKKFILPEDGISLDDLERDLIVQALERAKRNKAVAAKLLRISYDSFRYQAKKLGLDG